MKPKDVRIENGERAMLIKDAFGDRMIVLGKWANRIAGVPGKNDSQHCYLFLPLL